MLQQTQGSRIIQRYDKTMREKKQLWLWEINVFGIYVEAPAGQRRERPPASLLGTILSSAPHIKFHPSVHFCEIATIPKWPCAARVKINNIWLWRPATTGNHISAHTPLPKRTFSSPECVGAWQRGLNRWQHKDRVFFSADMVIIIIRWAI